MAIDDAPSLLTAYVERRAELLRYFSARLRSADLAEELVQDIYLKIAQRTDGEPIENPGAYLYRLGSNLMLDRIKQARRAANRIDAYAALYASEEGEQRSEDPPADEALAARQRLDAIVAAVRELPPPVQRAFRLHKLEGLSHAETAAAMNVSRSSVEKYLMTSLKHIAARVGR